MAQAAVSTSFRTVSLSVSTLLWAGLLIAAVSVAPRMVQVAPPTEGPPITIIMHQPTPPPVTPHEDADPTPRTAGETTTPVDIAPPPTIDIGPTDPVAGPVSLVEAPPVVVRPRWIHKPTGRELAGYFPARAIDRGKSGFVSLACTVRTSGYLACAIAEETPAGWGFGAAALRISQTYQMEPATRGGVPVEALYTLRVPFELH